MKTWRGFCLAMVVGLGVMIANCGDENDDDDAPACDCEFEQNVEENGLVLTFENQQVRTPANVSVLFKVETKDGVPIPTLTAADFKLDEDGSFISAFESQQAILPKPGSFRSHTILLLDLSGSILLSNSLSVLKDAAKTFVNAVLPLTGSANFGEIDMSIRWFDGSESVHSLVGFTQDAAELIAGIDSITGNISADNSTNLYGAVIQGVEQAKSMTGTNQDDVSVGAVVMFTDGKDQANRRTKNDALAAIQNTGQYVPIYAIGLGGEIEETELETFGRDGFVLAKDLQELAPKFEQIAKKVKDDVGSHYLLEYCSPKRGGAHILNISITYQGLSGSLSRCFCANGFGGGCQVVTE